MNTINNLYHSIPIIIAYISILNRFINYSSAFVLWLTLEVTTQHFNKHIFEFLMKDKMNIKLMKEKKRKMKEKRKKKKEYEKERTETIPLNIPIEEHE